MTSGSRSRPRARRPGREAATTRKTRSTDSAGLPAEHAADVETLYAAHAGPLYAFALRATGDAQASEEIVQDTFVRAWRAMDRFDDQRGDLQAWLFAIARNLVVDHYRRRGARPSVPVPGERLEGQPDPVSDIDRAVDVWQVAEALQQLSDAHREVIEQIHLRGASVAETAQRLGVPAGTVKSRVYYGLKALRLALEETGALR